MPETPMVDDVSLAAVQWVRQETEQGFATQQVAGLDGTLHQKLGRRSHRVTLAGVLLSDSAKDDLAKLQEKASSGAEVSFTADISSALSVDKMVIESFAAEQEPGAGGQFRYLLTLAESPPLPPPAEVSSFGGLDGIGDLGFDAGALGDVASAVADQAGAITGAVDAALDAVDQLKSLAALGDLGDVGNPLKPLADSVGQLSDVGPKMTGLLGSVHDLLGP